jgi:tRNA pseudouridine55 synthase
MTLKNNIDGILNINKPAGMSSFKCLSIVKRKLGLKKVGFLGTLDPLACGVLVLLCGTCTKMANTLHEGEKVYQSIFEFGRETTTLDNEGEIVATSDIIPMREQIKKILPEMIGDIEIEVPKFSAVHINGKRAYDLARKGIEFTAPKRIVKVMRFELLEQKSDNEFFFEIECQTGTYIRSLAKLMAQKLGTVAIASLIIRTRVGNFGIENARDIEKIGLDDLIVT